MRVLLIDDHPMIFDAFKSLLEREGTNTKLEFLTSLGESINRLSQPPGIDLVLLDLTLPGHSGISALTEFHLRYPDVPVVVLSVADDQATVDACLSVGIRGYLHKTLDRDAMLDGLERLVRGETFIAPPQAARQFMEPAQLMAQQFGLTAKQVDVLRHLVQGKSNREIALALNQSINTTQVHVSAVLHAVGAANRTEAVTIAARFGLFAP